MDIVVHYVEDGEAKITKSLSFQPSIKVRDLWETIYRELGLASEEAEYVLYIKDEDNLRTEENKVGEINFDENSSIAQAAANEEYGLETGMELIVEISGTSDEASFFGKKDAIIHIANATDKAVTVELHSVEDKHTKIPSRKFTLSVNTSAVGGGATVGMERGEVAIVSNEHTEMQDIFPHGSEWLTCGTAKDVNVVLPSVLTASGAVTKKRVKTEEGVIICENAGKVFVVGSASKGKKGKPIQNWRKFGQKTTSHPHKRNELGSVCLVCNESVEDWQTEIQ